MHGVVVRGDDAGTHSQALCKADLGFEVHHYAHDVERCIGGCELEMANEAAM